MPPSAPGPPNHRLPPDDYAPSLLERLGCFLFVALPLIFGIPVARAYAVALGPWVLPAYLLLCGGLLLFTFYVLERDDT